MFHMQYQVQVQNPDSGRWASRFADIYATRTEAQKQVNRLTKGYGRALQFRVAKAK